MKFCNGEKDITMLLGFQMLPINRVLGEFSFISNGKDGDNAIDITQPNLVKAKLFGTKRIPFASDGSGNFLCLDYEPEKFGVIGQIIYLPFGDPEPITVVANSFDDFLEFLMNQFNKGIIDFQDTYEEGNKVLNVTFSWSYGWSTTKAKLLED